MIKRQIISLYEEDFKKIDDSGRISALYHSIPAQLQRILENIGLQQQLEKKQYKSRRTVV